MEKKDFSHLKYYVKRLKEMGFKGNGTDERDKCSGLDFVKYIDGYRRCYVHFKDYLAYNKDCSPYFMLHFWNDKPDKTNYVIIYTIGVDKVVFSKNFKKELKQICGKQSRINTYPTWRAAFNQLVADYHDLETNTQRGNFFIS